MENTSHQAHLLACLQNFQAYLGLDHAWRFAFVSFGSQGDLMKPVDKQTIHFNSDMLKVFSPDFAVMVFLHEAYHAMKQGVQSMQQVDLIRDSVGWLFMQLLDVEADLVTAKYLKERHHYTLERYLTVYQSGIKAFSNVTPRRPKFERFIGSMISVHDLFIHNQSIIYTPNLSIPNTIVLIAIENELRFFSKSCEPSFINGFIDLYAKQDSLPLEVYLESLGSYVNSFKTLLEV